MEIERKWLFDKNEMSRLFNTNNVTHYYQGYISVQPEIRIRKK